MIRSLGVLRAKGFAFLVREPEIAPSEPQSPAAGAVAAIGMTAIG